MDPFNGMDDTSAWLKCFNDRFKKKTSSYKLKKFRNLVEGECRLWWDRLGDVGNEWAVTREAFRAYWIDSLKGDASTVKCRDITSSPVSVNTVTAAPPPPPVTKPEPLEAHPMFSIVISTSIIDPCGILLRFSYPVTYASLLIRHVHLSSPLLLYLLCFSFDPT
ncbi:hypothetical protein Moror_5889 [Moniliophthora roreri MCA 2997]|uniref:Uncharacterized protein n=1 Tax=Moniliophthora roreri (strain MCA 2997) TaxID=1381753 RepID=V2WY10_MONRO|nr:hypothetical protein Moror_5889 [Moniliophthora roreri MCA 2997]